MEDAGHSDGVLDTWLTEVETTAWARVVVQSSLSSDAGGLLSSLLERQSRHLKDRNSLFMSHSNRYTADGILAHFEWIQVPQESHCKACDRLPTFLRQIPQLHLVSMGVLESEYPSINEV